MPSAIPRSCACAPRARGCETCAPALADESPAASRSRSASRRRTCAESRRRVASSSCALLLGEADAEVSRRVRGDLLDVFGELLDGQIGRAAQHLFRRLAFAAGEKDRLENVAEKLLAAVDVPRFGRVSLAVDARLLADRLEDDAEVEAVLLQAPVVFVLVRLDDRALPASDDVLRLAVGVAGRAVRAFLVGDECFHLVRTSTRGRVRAAPRA